MDDETAILEVYAYALEGAGFDVKCLTDADGLFTELKVKKPDIFILDIMLEGLDGYEILKRLRLDSACADIPVIMVSAKGEEVDKVKGLNLGADDYMVKPFNPLELIARINANLRRFYKLGNVQEEDDGKITIGELTLDTNTLTLEKNGVPVNLTATEYKILLMLMKSPGRVFTKMQIYEEVNGDYYANDDNTMMVHISNLRDKIEDDPKNPRYIKTLRGLGYKVEKQ